jgi:2-polyprenyl-3-methyl-5-hydroxy-6-metoxy-1,4-benzoquinol methylase
VAESIYDAAVDPERPNNPHAIALQLVGEGKRVLELGSAAGHVTRALVARANEVVCVELDAEAAMGTDGVAQRTIVTDLDWMDLPARLGDERFEVVLAGDVLEHTREPGLLLRLIRGLLSDGGYVVASLPNVAHGDVRLMLLDGRFEYHDLGLLDRTHLRFFTKATLRDTFAEAGYRISQHFTVTAPLGGTELGVDLATFPQEVVKRIADDPESIVYQYVVRADPLQPSPDYGVATPPFVTPDADVARLTHQLNAMRRQLAERVAELSAELRSSEHLAAERAGAIEHLEGALRSAEDSAAARAGAIAHLEGRVNELEAATRRRWWRRRRS